MARDLPTGEGMCPLAGSLAVAVLLGAAASPADRYPEAVARLAADREALAAEYRKAPAKSRPEIVARARARLERALDEELLPAWYGTPWEFHGTSETPGKGTIACGYLVSTVLRDAGLRVARVRLAQQASENIVRTLAPADRIRRLKHQTNAQVVEEVRRQGSGWYVVGFDYHVGFLRIDGEAARFCHSSFIGGTGVVCEAPEGAGAFSSTLHVVGEALPDARVLDWLLQRAIPTVGNQKS